jgi:glucokinase
MYVDAGAIVPRILAVLQMSYCRQTFHSRPPNSRIRLDGNAIIDG